MKRDDLLGRRVRKFGDEWLSGVAFHDRLQEQTKQRMRLEKKRKPPITIRLSLLTGMAVVVIGALCVGTLWGDRRLHRGNAASSASSAPANTSAHADSANKLPLQTGLAQQQSPYGVSNSTNVKADRAFVASDAIAKVVSEKPDFPNYSGKTAGVIHGGGPAPGIKVPGQLETGVVPAGQPGAYLVTLQEYWNAKDFHYAGQNGPQLSHYWKYRVTVDAVVLIDQGGDFPPQYVK